jgi:hypothetical protein
MLPRCGDAHAEPNALSTILTRAKRFRPVSERERETGRERESEKESESESESESEKEKEKEKERFLAVWLTVACHLR